MSQILVLNDGETFTDIDGCAVFEVPEHLEDDDIELALKDGELQKVRDLRERAPDLIRIVFSTDDVRAFAEEADVDFDLAMSRAEEWADAIEQRATELCSEQLLAVVRDNQP